MKLLILTQKMDQNDDNLGSFHDWLKEFSQQVEKITVICLYKGEYSLPPDVSVYSLGKESGISRFKYIFNFYKYIFKFRNDYDAVFVHMNPEYIILGGWFWKLTGKKIGLWYTHKKVNLRLRLAEKWADFICSASKESFRLQSHKLKILGHGINTDRFKPPSLNGDIATIISVGRIAPVKNYELLIEAAEILDRRGVRFNINIVGAPILGSDTQYLEKLRESVAIKKLEEKIHFLGGMPYGQVMNVFSVCGIFVNFSDTGSIDRAVLEAMSAGLLILTSNEAFRDILADKYFTSKDSKIIAEKLSILMKSVVDPSLRQYVIVNHNLQNLIRKILLLYV